jgi:mono/diheme cytochrome c family protein
MSSSVSRSSLVKLVGLGGALAVGACTAPGGPDAFKGKSEFPGQSIPTGAGGSTVIQEDLKCVPVQSSEPIPPRTTLTDGSGETVVHQATYFTDDLFKLWKADCGSCHADSNLGGFQVSRGSFATKVDESVYEIITSNNPDVVMPPVASGGMTFDVRVATNGPTDPIVRLAALLRQWLDQGSSDDAFLLSAESDVPATQGYAMTPTLAAQLTNIGSCVPDKRMVGLDGSGMDRLDALFAAADSFEKLPRTLGETDLFTLDSAELAKSGVISYAPTYPLWTDNAGKMRYVRVPRGKSITFDKAKQQFNIPANTRFYKTFLKELVDANGNKTYRKIETRMIVARPDDNRADGTYQTALYGTYVWNDDESQAELLNDPLRSGAPFADRIFSYVTDEQKAQAIRDKNPANLSAALDGAGITRHYLLPGSERCVQCHMGSPSQSFILGFTPLQVARRETGTGGVYEPASGDELTQLQRLIDYGVITGVSSPADLLPLEKSQGSRAPRGPEELLAQAYMVGNCAHCHNRRGYPSVKQPALADQLIFLPGPGDREGVFQMSLELMSPTRKRGLNQDTPIPYITPSLYDLPRTTSTEKFFCPANESGICTPADPPVFVLAPWRSLIYRNIDTPYDYFDDYAPFPHMPLNSPGYDCRVTTIMGDWMVSIPAVLKHPDKAEAALPAWAGESSGDFGSNANTDPQPYQEVKPGDSRWDEAMSALEWRKMLYHDLGYRYGFCPDTYTKDVIDPVIQDLADRHQPITSDLGSFTNPKDPTQTIMPRLTPIRPHLVSFDDTDPPGDWFPRRPDWADALVDPDITKVVAAAKKNDNLSDGAAQDLANVLGALGAVHLTTDLRNALLREVPVGLWDTTTAGCNFNGIPTAGSFQGADRPEWMKMTNPPDSAPVYMESLGAAVFTTVCYNCHGVNADSKGLLSDAITNLTGGDARVANFRDGLFGPVTNPGANRGRVFGDTASMHGLTSDDLAARYMAWMALGGTEKHLPQDVLNQVSLSPMLGQVRAHIATQGTPDMLKLGLDLCALISTSEPLSTIPMTDFVNNGQFGWSKFSGLIDKNGDAEMWLQLCNLGNRQLVRVPMVPDDTWKADTTTASLTIQGYGLYYATSDTGEDYYGANPVLDQHGNVVNGVKPDNLFPICIAPPPDAQRANADKALAAGKVQGKSIIPYCPSGFVTPAHALKYDSSTTPATFPEARKWAARGAINAALAVFTYLDALEKTPSIRKPLYNQCSMLPK